VRVADLRPHAGHSPDDRKSMPEGDYTLILILLALGVMMWWSSRRARARQKEAARFRDLLAPGQDVMTGSGFFGTVAAVDGDRITLTSEGNRTVWLRQAIAKVVEPETAASDETADDTASAPTPDDRDQPHS
jgi:preprotein translocase subunit YajC